MNKILLTLLIVGFTLNLNAQMDLNKSDKDRFSLKGDVLWMWEGSYNFTNTKFNIPFGRKLKTDTLNTYYEFNKQGEFKYIVQFGEKQKAKYRTAYFHDKAGNKSLSAEFKENNLLRTRHYNYNAQNLYKSELTTKRYPGSVSEFSSKKKYVYNNHGQLVEVQNFDTDQEKLTSKDQIVYDEQENSEEFITYNSNGKATLSIKDYYDASDKVKKSVWSLSTIKNVFEYKYNEQGDPVIETETHHNSNSNELRIIQDSIVYRYDAKGNWISKIVYRNNAPIALVKRHIAYHDGSIEPKKDYSEKFKRIFIPDNNPETIYEYRELRNNTIQITRYWGTKNSIIIPSHIQEKPVTSIGNESFSKPQQKSLYTVQFPSTLKHIGEEAFDHNGMRRCILPNSVQKIEKQAFAYNEINELKLPDNLKIIDEKCFYKNNIEELHLPTSIVEIKERAFAENNIQSITFSENLKTIGPSAFALNQLTKIKLPPKLERIELRAFRSNDISEVYFPNSLDYIGKGAFLYNDNFDFRLPKLERDGLKLKYWQDHYGEKHRKGTKIKDSNRSYTAVFE